MKIRIFISVFSFVIFSFLISWFQVSATQNNLHIIPEISEEEKQQAAESVDYVGDPNKWGTAIERYNEKAEEIDKSGNLWMAFQTWEMTWNTPLNAVVYVMKFLSQLGLLIWWIMMLYAGYQYATTIFGYGDPNTAKTSIKNAIIWVIVVIASYAILRGLRSLFL